MMLNERKLGNPCKIISKSLPQHLLLRESDYYSVATLSKEIREASHCNLVFHKVFRSVFLIYASAFIFQKSEKITKGRSRKL